MSPDPAARTDPDAPGAASAHSGEVAPPGAGSVAGFVALAGGVALVLMAVGYLPTRRLGGPEAVTAMFVGCGVSLVASVIGILPLALSPADSTPHGRLNRILGALGLRLAAVFLLGAGVGLSGWFAVKPLLLWIAGSYMALLVIDTLYALKRVGSR